MKRSDFDYALPQELIAQYPPARRGDSRLLCLDGGSGRIEDSHFDLLPEFLGNGDLLVFNDTRVIPARLYGRKASGGRVEVLIERILGKDAALAQVRASKAPKPGGRLLVGEVIELEVKGRRGEFFELAAPGGSILEILEREGHMPLPPYISRDDGALDGDRYQTVYASRPGAVAAPTAGLHFTEEMFDRLEARGVRRINVTLHVGAGTFQPVRVESLDDHRMHSEYLEVGEAACRAVAETRRRGGRVVAVGTTSVRSLETAASSGEIAPFEGDTRLFITPGYRFRVVDAMITNFHLPESTLLMLVCAFSGYAEVMSAYRHAVEQGYRFFSYGDAMFLTRKPG